MHLLTRATVCLLVLFAAWKASFAAEVLVKKQLVLFPQADTMIRDSDLPPGGGSSSSVAVGTTRDNRHARALLKFDVPTLPPGSTLTNAYAVITVSQVPGSGLPGQFSLHRMLQPWDELEATWESTGFSAWGGAGGLEDTDYAGLSSATTILDRTGRYEFRDTNIFNDAELWMTNADANMGWMVLCDEETLWTAKRFITREANYPESEPQLVLEYSAPMHLELTHLRVEGNQIAFDFIADAGRDYFIEYKDSLEDPEWYDFDYYPDPGVETTITFHDYLDGEHRYYRVVSP